MSTSPGLKLRHQKQEHDTPLKNSKQDPQKRHVHHHQPPALRDHHRKMALLVWGILLGHHGQAGEVTVPAVLALQLVVHVEGIRSIALHSQMVAGRAVAERRAIWEATGVVDALRQVLQIFGFWVQNAPSLDHVFDVLNWN